MYKIKKSKSLCPRHFIHKTYNSEVVRFANNVLSLTVFHISSINILCFLLTNRFYIKIKY